MPMEKMPAGQAKNDSAACCCGPASEMLPIYRPPTDEHEPCCGPPAGPPSSAHERPGYRVCPFVLDFIQSPAGAVPRVKTHLERSDWIGTARVRAGVGRSSYKVAPGLYAVGHPDAAAPVVVSANYKLSFDHLRQALGSHDAWILVLDTRGINVWCAAGKGTFGTAEIIRQVRSTGLTQVVAHRRLIVPQLGATGVSAREVRHTCGFEVVWGPVRAADLKAFLAAGLKSDAAMRQVTFTLRERLVLIPVEISLLRIYLLWTFAALFVLSGIGSHLFSLSAAWHRGLLAAGATTAGILAGCAVVPALLPWMPGRAFALKGVAAGLALGGGWLLIQGSGPWLSAGSALAQVLWATTVSSFLAMNFTGSTPFTSPSGVEKEMRRAIPLQLAAALAAAAMWVGGGF